MKSIILEDSHPQITISIASFAIFSKKEQDCLFPGEQQQEDS